MMLRHAGQRLGLDRLIAWLEARPALAWSGMLLLAIAVAADGIPYWPQAGWAGGLPGNTMHGGDALGIQAVMAFADRRQIWEWLTGPSIDERTYRPLMTLVHWLEFQWWGTRDVRYSWLSIGLFLANTALLAALAARVAAGGLATRLLVGLSAAALFAGRWFADDYLLQWIFSYWPAQSDAFSLGLSLASLLLLLEFLDRGGAAWLAACLATLVAAAWFKEIALVAAAMGILLTLRRGRHGQVAMAGIGATAAALVLARVLALRGELHYQPNTDAGRFQRLVAGPWGTAYDLVVYWPLCAAAIVLLVAGLLRWRSVPPGRVLLAAGAALLAASQLLGGHLLLFAVPPYTGKTLDAAIGVLVFWAGLRELPRRRGAQMFAVGWLLAAYVISPYRLALSWYQYWPLALRAALIALLLPEAVRLLAWLLGRSGAPTEHVAAAALKGARRVPDRPRRRRVPALPLALLVGAILLSIPAIQRPNSQPVPMPLSRFGPYSGPGSERLVVNRPREVGPRARRPAVLILGGEAAPTGRWSIHRLAQGLARLGYVTACPDQDAARRRLVSETAARQAVRRLRAAADDSDHGPLRRDAIAVFGWDQGGRLACRVVMEPGTPDSDPDVRHLSGQAFCAVNLGGKPDDHLLQRLKRPPQSARQSLPPLPEVSGPATRAPRPALYFAWGEGDAPALLEEFRAVEAAARGGPWEVQLYQDASRGPLFPRRGRYWKGSLDLAIEFLFRVMPPPPVP